MISEHDIERWVGSSVHGFTVSLSQGRLTGYMCNDSMPEEAAFRRLALHQEEAVRANGRLFCGSSDRVLKMLNIDHVEGVFLYVVESQNEADIAEFCDVGVREILDSVEAWRRIFQNQEGPGDWSAAAEFMAGPKPDKIRSQIRAFMGRVLKRMQYRVDFADKRGLKAHFVRKVMDNEAEWLEREIAKVNIEAFDVADPLTMKEYILLHNRFVLWWD